MPQSLHDLSKIEETNKTFFLLSHLMTSPRDHKDLDLPHAAAQLRCAHEDQLCLGAQGPYVAAGYHDDDYHYTLPCVGGPTDRQAAAQAASAPHGCSRQSRYLTFGVEFE